MASSRSSHIWGPAGLYRGTHDKDVFERRDHDDDKANLTTKECRALVPGDEAQA